MSGPVSPRLRWYQYRLRTLFLLMLAVALGMGLVAVPLQKAWRQKAAADGIRKLGGVVEYDYQPGKNAAAWAGVAAKATR